MGRGRRLRRPLCFLPRLRILLRGRFCRWMGDLDCRLGWCGADSLFACFDLKCVQSRSRIQFNPKSEAADQSVRPTHAQQIVLADRFRYGGELMRTLIGIVLVFVVLMFGASLSWGQARVEDGGHEIQLWTGGGYSVPGGTSNTGIWNAGLRYGWILTRPHLPGFLKGRFEYALDAVPVFVVFQPANTAFGAGFNPL